MKHFKMYITKTDIMGKKRIDFGYPIKNFNNEVVVVKVFGDNIRYDFKRNLGH